MNPCELFIRRPVTTCLIMAAILLAGVVAYNQLPVSDLPNVDFPTIQVVAWLPGANPETMASAVATPLEREFCTIAGVDSMNSTSYLGSCTVTIQFTLGRNIDAAAQDVQMAISRASRRLPPDMPTPPVLRKVNPADEPILFLALTSPTLPMSRLDDYGQVMLAQRISMIEGVAQVQVYGSQKYAVRVRLDPVELASRGIGMDEVQAVIENYNVNLPLGTMNGADQAYTIQANGQLMEAERYMPLIVAYRNGQPVRLQEVGRADDSVENDKVAAWYTENGVRHRSVILAIQRQPGANTLKVARAVKALLPTFREQLPASVNLGVFRDNSIPIEESVEDVQYTFVLTLGLVILVIFLFLRNLSATLIPSLALPMSIVGTFGVMYLLDYSLDNLSLMALTLCVGFVVDDAIVMLENIVRHLEMGKGRLQAALEGSKEIVYTIVSMTLALCAVFIPVLFMSGIVGRLFREFAVTIAVAVLISGVVSLTLTPMLCSRMLRAEHNRRHGRFYRATEWLFNLGVRFYGWTLRPVLRHPFLTVLASLGVFAWTGYLFTVTPKGFLPSEDRDQIRIRTEASQDVSFDRMARLQLQAADIVQQDPNVDVFMCSIGATTTQGGTMNDGRLFLSLKPKSQRTQRVNEVIAGLRRKLEPIKDLKFTLTNPPPISLGGRMARTLYQYTLVGSDTAELYRYAAQMEDRIRRMDGFQDVSSDMQLRNPQLQVQIDRDRAFVLHVTPRQIENALYTAFGTRQISTIYAPDNQYQVIMELLPEFQRGPQALGMLYIRSSSGQLVPLDAVTQQYDDVGPVMVNHAGQLPSVTINFNLRPGMSIGEAMESIRGTIASDLPMPAGMSAMFQGTAQAFQDSLGSMVVLLPMAVLVIYLVLGILYEDLLYPLAILSALPFGAVGALMTLQMFGAELGVYAFVGIIMLVGLVKKNGIMMVDFAIEARRSQGKGPEEAMFDACVIRFRPILMTAISTIAGALPIALGYGAGAEARQPLGLAVVGGLIFSQTLTLYVTPAYYIVLEKLRDGCKALTR